MLGLAVVPAVIFGAGMLFLPETPRWLIHRGAHDAAHVVLKRIRASDDLAAEVREIRESLVLEQATGKFRDLLAPRIRPAVIVGLGLAVLQQITGINTVIYYAPRIRSASAGWPRGRRRRSTERRTSAFRSPS